MQANIATFAQETFNIESGGGSQANKTLIKTINQVPGNPTTVASHPTSAKRVSRAAITYTMQTSRLKREQFAHG
jgi:hypothetical protein